jgi:Raf kinase inhibitor-like YbhB/YbcL family protein
MNHDRPRSTLLATTLAVALGGATFTSAPAADAAGFKLTVEGLDKGNKIAAKNVFNSFGCTGENVSPALSWTGAPKDAKAFAVTVYDPDAPTGSGWWHWVVYNLPADTTSLPEGAGSGAGKLPAGAQQGRTDFGKPGYGGPCPPPGKPHRYVFKVFALKAPIEVPADASPAMIGFNLNGNKLAEAEVTAKYGR